MTDSFDEDVHGMYDVLVGLGYNDDHIFYVSPWTTDPGVDRVTSLANVQWAITEVAANSDANDKVFFLFASHGDVDRLSCNVWTRSLARRCAKCNANGGKTVL